MAGGTPISGDSRNVGDITQTFRIEPATVKVGQTVRLSINLQNNSGRDETLRFSSGKRYDFYVTKDGREVWRWSQGRAFIQALTTEVIPGAVGKRYTETWQPQSPGTYTAHAVVEAARFGTPLSGTVTVQ